MLASQLNLRGLAVAFLLLFGTLHAQNVGIGTSVPDNSAKLHIEANDMGLLIPNVSIADTAFAVPVTAPATGLLVWNNNASTIGGNGEGFYYWDGTKWVMLAIESPSGDEWLLLGNAGTSSANNFVGTTDDEELVFRTNNTEDMRISTNGNVSIGTVIADARLRVEIGSTDILTNYGIYNEYAGGDPANTYAIYNENTSATNNAKYGIYNNVSNNGSGARYGIYNNVVHNTSLANAYGIYNTLNARGDGDNATIWNYLNINSSVGDDENYAQYSRILAPSSFTYDTYGEYIDMDFTSGIRYGEFKEMNSSSSASTAPMYGDYNQLKGSGDGAKYGVFNEMDGTGDGIHHAVENNFTGGGPDEKAGLYNVFENQNGTKYGTYTNVESGSGSGVIYGNYNNLQNNGSDAKYGQFNNIGASNGTLYGSYSTLYPSSGNSNNAYGVYGFVDALGSGTHYGGYFMAGGDGNYAVHGTNSADGGYAGYFNGNFHADGASTFNESGDGGHDLRIEGGSLTHLLFTDAGIDQVRIGSAADAGGNNNLLLDVDNGAASGTQIGIGSIEVLTDGVAETTINNAFSPSVTSTHNLGSPTLLWNAVYAANGTIQTSDERYKKEVRDLNYGLEEVMQLRPVSYKWKEQQIGSTQIPVEMQERKLGLIAQEVQQVVPEVVETHTWLPEGEENPEAFVRTENDKLGMSYDELIPVMVKAMQEQQELIEKQNERITELERKLNTENKH